MTCAEARDLLPDHVLAMTPEIQDAAVRRHLRGCAACRAELAALEEGLATFADTVAGVDPPAELRTRVLSTLEDDWREAPAPTAGRRPRVPWLAAAAAALVLVASVAWGVGQARRADRAVAGATSYERLLSTLGGTEFRVGALRAVGGSGVRGSVLLYESAWGRSWAAIFVRADATGSLSATLSGPDGTSLRFDPIWTSGGEGDGWLVTDADLGVVERVTVRDAGGTVLATGDVSDA